MYHDISDCIHLKELSCYNYNFYKLPFKVNEYDILLASFDGGERYDGGQLGFFDENKKFQTKFWLHTDEEGILDIFIFDSEDISKTFKWT